MDGTALCSFVAQRHNGYRAATTGESNCAEARDKGTSTAALELRRRFQPARIRLTGKNVLATFECVDQLPRNRRAYGWATVAAANAPIQSGDCKVHAGGAVNHAGTLQRVTIGTWLQSFHA